MVTYLLLSHPYDARKKYLSNFIPVEFRSLIDKRKSVDIYPVHQHFVASLDSELTQAELYQLQTAVTFYKIQRIFRTKKKYESIKSLNGAVQETVLSIKKNKMRKFLPSKFPYNSIAQASPYLLRFMVNIAIGGRIVEEVFDPLCSHGQILCDIASRGINSVGIEIDDNTWYCAVANVETFLKRRSKRLTVEAMYKGVFISAKSVTVKIFNDDTCNCDTHLEENSVDAIVTDIPYGVLTHAKINGVEATTLDLVKLCAPKWAKLLNQSGRIALAYNAMKTDRKTITKVLVDAGFQQLYPNIQLQHLASNQILREIFIGEKN